MARIRATGAVLLAVAADTPADAEALAERLGLDFPVVSDAELEIIDAYGLRQAGKDVSLPAVYVLDGDRKVVWRQVSSGIVERANLDDVLGAVPQAR